VATTGVAQRIILPRRWYLGQARLWHMMLPRHADLIADRSGGPIIIPMPEIHRISQAAFDRLAAEHKDLTGRGRIDIADKIEVARLMGDLKENGDYHAAKEEQGKMEGRVAKLASIINNCEILEEIDSSTVSPGCTIELRYEGDTVTERMLFGSIEEHRDDLEICSPGSPLGVALEGSRVGDKIAYTAPSGASLTVEVISVEH
jgi:transcription elongation factor GreA